MSEIVEKVARAVMIADGCGCTFEGERVFCDHPGLPEEVQGAHCGCKENARAAIKATLEHLKANVSDGMAVAGCNHDDPLGRLVDWKGGETTTREAVSGVFAAMISQALTELEA